MESDRAVVLRCIQTQDPTAKHIAGIVALPLDIALVSHPE